MRDSYQNLLLISHFY